MGAGGSSYIPRPDVKFYEWGMQFTVYARAHHARWEVAAPAENMEELLDDFARKLDKCMKPTRSRVDTLLKNEARKLVEGRLRRYVQGMVARNENVTDEDREMMGLPKYERNPKPVGDPVGLVTAMVKYIQEGALELNIVHVEGTPYDKRANYGVKIAYGVFPLDAPMPANASQLHHSRFTRRKKEVFAFEQDVARHTACFCLCYENSRGREGRWGPMISAVIP